MFNATTICESVRRHWLPIVIIVALCFCAGVGSSFVKKGKVVTAPSYTAEAALYVTSYGFQDNAEKNAAYIFIVDEDMADMAVAEVKRIVTSDAVAGEVRRELGEDIVITVPYWVDGSTNTEQVERFVYIDVQASDPVVALDAARRAANLAIETALELLPISNLVLCDGPYLKSSGSDKAADWGKDSFVNLDQQSAAANVASGISIKNIVIYVFVGVALSVFGFAAYDILSRRIRSSRDVERLLDVPVIAVLSKEEEYGHLAENLRVLAARFGIDKLSVAGLCKKDEAAAVVEGLAAIENLPELTIATLADDPACVGAVAKADAVLLVVKCAAAKGSQVEQALKTLKIADVPVLGAVYVSEK